MAYKYDRNKTERVLSRDRALSATSCSIGCTNTRFLHSQPEKEISSRRSRAEEEEEESKQEAAQSQPEAGGFSREAPLNPFTKSYFQCFHLEAHECDLSRGNVRPTLGDGHTGDVVAVSMQEILFLSIYCLNEDSAAQRVNQMFLVRMAFQTSGHMSYKREIKNNNTRVQKWLVNFTKTEYRRENF